MSSALGREGATRKPWHPLPRSGLAPHTFFQFSACFPHSHHRQSTTRPPQFTKTRDLVLCYLTLPPHSSGSPASRQAKQAIREAGIGMSSLFI